MISETQKSDDDKINEKQHARIGRLTIRNEPLKMERRGSTHSMSFDCWR